MQHYSSSGIAPCRRDQWCFGERDNTVAIAILPLYKNENSKVDFKDVDVKIQNVIWCQPESAMFCAHLLGTGMLYNCYAERFLEQTQEWEAFLRVAGDLVDSDLDCDMTCLLFT